MSRYRLPALALFISALLAVVAIVADGRPLGGGARHGTPSSSFFNYVWTSVVIFVIAAGLAIVLLLATGKSTRQPIARPRGSRLAAVFFVGVLGLLFWALASKGFERRFQQLEARLHLTRPNGQTAGPIKGHRAGHGAQLQWDEVAVVLALLAALGVAAFVSGRRRPAPRPWQFASQAAVSAALDESLDDLRSEPDLRKAIIAAYARMERALALAGLPRRPAEAPLEYVERTLGELETSSGAIRRLTDLFEWAKFSPHEPEPSMRNEAIEALVAVRDELRAPAAEPVPA